MKPKVCVLRTAGTNCDNETAFAFSLAGANAELAHVNSLVGKKGALRAYHILALPGGFSYGDDIASGKILANELKYKLAREIDEFIKDGKLIIGICNGFQILVKSGLLPGNTPWRQETSLIINDSGKFEDRWVYLRNSPEGNAVNARSRCIWTKGLPGIIYLPVAHGEGKFIVKDASVLARMNKDGQVALRYCDRAGRMAGYPDNPNGSTDDIAGICDVSGRIFGLMPHPERHVNWTHHPRWSHKGFGDGLMIFENGVNYIKKNF